MLFSMFRVRYPIVRNALSADSHRILLHWVLHFIAFCLAFSGILACVLVLNALRFGAKYGVFGCKWHLIGQCLHINTTPNALSTCVSSAPFCTKTNPRENWIFAMGWGVGG